MKQIITILALIIIGLPLQAQWTSIHTDATGDEQSIGLLDGTTLEYNYDAAADSIWIRIGCTDISGKNVDSFGTNVMVRFPNPSLQTFDFWGADNQNPYHRLATTWVVGSAPSNYSGTIGISDSAGVDVSNYSSLTSNNIHIIVDSVNNQITLGFDRGDLVPTSEFTNDTVTVLVAAAVGSNVQWNDDIYSPTGTMFLDRNSVGTITLSKNDITVYPNPASHKIQIRANQSAISEIEFYSMEGKLIKREMVNMQANETMSMNVSHFVTGAYIMRVIHENKNVSVKQILIH